MQQILNVLFTAVFGIILFSLSSCAILMQREQLQLSPPYCPVPVQNCEPRREGIRVLDTGLTMDSQWYYVLKPIRGANSPEHEYHIWITEDEQAFLTLKKNEKQIVQVYHRSTPENFHFVDVLLLPFRNYGLITAVQNALVFAAVQFDRRWHESMLIESDSLNGGYQEVLAKENMWFSYPAFDVSGNVLFFSSNFGNALNGLDLWFILRTENGSWSAPIPLPAQINSSCDEIAPFVTEDGKWLLFASTGHSNVGGYDLFRVPILEKFWSAVRKRAIHLLRDSSFLQSAFGVPENCGIPINSVYDEISPFTPADADSILYFASNRKSNGDFDIYCFRKVRRPSGTIAMIDTLETRNEQSEPVEMQGGRDDHYRGNTLQDERAIVRGKVIDAQNRKPVAEGEVRSIVADSLFDQSKTDTLGNFTVTVPKRVEAEIEVRAPGYFPTKTRIFAEQDTVPLPADTISLKRFLFVRIHFPTDEYQNPYPYVLDENGFPTQIQWQTLLDDVAESIIRDSAILSQVLIIGHTDDVASEEYNYQLGLRRATFIYNQLVARNVPQNLLWIESKGEMAPLPRKEGEPLALYRKRLRRVEIVKIPKSLGN